MFARVLVPQSAARMIQGMILSGEFKPGSRLPSQRDLSQSLKVSRASLREALLTLETLGLLRTEPGRGTFISETRQPGSNSMARWRYADSYSVVDVFQTRIMLEGKIAALSAGTLSAKDLDALSEAADEMERHWAAGDILSNVEADLSFHGIIAAGCRNRMLVDFYQSVRNQITETQRQPIPMTESARMSDSIAEHRRIIEALRAGDARRAQFEMETHIRNTARCGGVEVG